MHASVASLDVTRAAMPRNVARFPDQAAEGTEDGVFPEPGSVEHATDPEALPYGPWGMRLYAVSKAFALAGGAVFIALVGMSLISIVGRKLWSLPVPGDFEVLQMGAAVAAGTFFAYCQMADGHVRVDFFTNWIPAPVRHLLDGLAALLMSAVALLVGWRTAVGAIASFESGETSLMLGWPGWISIALIVPSFLLFALTSFYVACRRFRSVLGDSQ